MYKSPTTGKLTEYDTQILCYGGDTSTGAATTGTNGQGTMVLNANRIGINKLNPSCELDVSDGTINAKCIGINKINPTTELDVDGMIKCTDLTVSNRISNLTLSALDVDGTITAKRIGINKIIPTTELDVNGMIKCPTLNVEEITFSNRIVSDNTFFNNGGNAPRIKISESETQFWNMLTVRNNINPSIYTEIGGLGVKSQNLEASVELMAEVITFMNNIPQNSVQVIRGAKDSTSFRKWNGSYNGLSQVHAKSFKIEGNYGFTPLGNVFANNIYPSMGVVNAELLTDSLPTLPSTTLPPSNQNYIMNGNFSSPSITSHVVVGDMTSGQLKSLYPWICYDGKYNVKLHDAATYSFPPFTDDLQGITQNIEIQNDASIYQIVNVPFDSSYRLQLYYAYSEFGYDINNYQYMWILYGDQI